MKSGTANGNGLELAFDQFGDGGNPAILLIMGNSAPGIVWPDRFCEVLADAGFCVIRYDQRDTGLSAYVDFEAHPYSLTDLVDDAFALLDHLGIRKAHFVGLSQGGNTALLAGLKSPSRVASLTTVMSSPDMEPKNDAFTGKPARPGQLPPPDPDYVSAVISLNSTPTQSDEDVAERFMQNFRLAAGPKSSFDEDFWLALGHGVAKRRRAQHAKMANHSNHSKAQMATAPLTASDLARLKMPCLVIHGEMDPIFPPAHAVWSASNLVRAELCIVPDMGHALDPAYFDAAASRIGTFLHNSMSHAEFSGD